MENSIDEVLATLAGMGFDIDKCQAAVNAGKVTVQAAVDWILQGGGQSAANQHTNRSIASRATPSLSLRSATPSQRTTSSHNLSYPSYMMPPIGTEDMIPASVEEQASSSNREDSQVVSRFSLRDDQKEDKDRWERKKREEDSSWFKENRKLEKQAKANILREIQADREARKNKASSSAPPPPPSPVDVTPASSQNVPPTVKKSESGCTLQIRMPSGKVLREKFTADCTLYTVIHRLRETDPNLPSVDFVQPFPPKKFTELNDFDKTLCELCLTPSASLVVRPAINEPPVKVQKQDIHLPGVSSSENAISLAIDEAGCSFMADGSNEDEEEVKEELRMDHSTEDGKERQNEDDPALARLGLPQRRDLRLPREAMNKDDGVRFMRGGPPRRHVQFEQDNIRQAGFGHMQRRHIRPHNWGEGHSLNDNAAVPDQENEERMDDELPDSAVVAAAAIQRLSTSCHGNAGVYETTTTEKPVLSLSNLCYKTVLKYIESEKPSVHLEAVPAHVAVELLAELKKSGTLRPKVLQLFLPCHLRDLSLDCYKYTTNELLQCVSRHTFLTRLSLTACPLITDQGLLFLTNLKRLQLLNVCNNWQVTDKVFHLTSKLCNLTTLILDGTSVTDEGLKILSSSGSNAKLTSLNLNRTAVSDVGVAYLANLVNISVLGLEKTQIKHLENISRLSKLRSLNISRNSLAGTSELKWLQKLTNLSVLNVGQMEDMLGDAVLFFLSGLGLKQLTLPDRHTTTDEGLKHIQDLPLVTLDLTDYIHVTDKGIEYISRIQSLKKLSLSNVKLTDAAMRYISGLSELLELELGRTLITNVGAAQVESLGRIQELSLAETKVTSKLLMNGALNRCIQLTHLNLSRTNVSSLGIKCLTLPKLTHLNLDQTYVKETDKCELMRNCPSLKVLRLNGLKDPPRFLDEDDG